MRGGGCSTHPGIDRPLVDGESLLATSLFGDTEQSNVLCGGKYWLEQSVADLSPEKKRKARLLLCLEVGSR